MRTMAVPQERGLCKAFGLLLPSSTTGVFMARVAACGIAVKPPRGLDGHAVVA